MVSVVVPVYNVEKYLENCLESLVNQSYKEYEIVLVNDGSTDNSKAICEKFEHDYSFIRLINKSNGGLSDARNVGVANSNGDYVVFVDSDDTVHKDFLLNLYNALKDFKADISVCEFYVYNEEDVLEEPNDVGTVTVYTGIDAMKLMLEGKVHGSSACAILMKKEMALEYPFPLGKYNEDDFTTFNFYANSKSVASTSQRMYYYLQRSNSIMHKPFGKAAIDGLDAADYLVEECYKFGKIFGESALIRAISVYMSTYNNYPDLRTVDAASNKRIKKTVRRMSFKRLFFKNNNFRTVVSNLILSLLGLDFYNKIRNKIK